MTLNDLERRNGRYFALFQRTRVLCHRKTISSVSLFSWSSHILQTPKCGGKRHNLTNVVKKRIQNSLLGISHYPERKVLVVGSMPLHLPLCWLSKLEVGNLRAVIKLLSSDDTPAQPSRLLTTWLGCKRNILRHRR